MAKNGKGKSRGSRGRKKVEDKADQVEVREGELELKTIEIDDGDFDMHLKSIKGAKERFDTAKRLYDSCCKSAKKVSEDLLNSIKRAIKFEGMDIADIKKQLEIDGYVLKRAGSSVQLTIHDTLLGDVNAAAEKRGHADGKAGRSANCPYPEGTELARLYFGGWNAGQAELIGADDDDGDDDDDGEHALAGADEREPAPVH